MEKFGRATEAAGRRGCWGGEDYGLWPIRQRSVGECKGLGAIIDLAGNGDRPCWHVELV